MCIQANNPQVSMIFDKLPFMIFVKPLTGSFTYDKSYVPLPNPPPPLNYVIYFGNIPGIQ